MALTKEQLVLELSVIVDPAFASAIIESYVEMQQRFLAGDWQPTEIDSGRLCEGAARAIYQVDSGTVTHSQLPKEVCEKIEDENNTKPHKLSPSDRSHICRAISLVYKFRSSRGSVHISPNYKADFMDSMLMVHTGKWILAEFLRIAWKKDKKIIAETIAEITQLEYSLIHELDGIPLFLENRAGAPVEVLLLLNNAQGHRLAKAELGKLAKNSTKNAFDVAVLRLLRVNEIRTTATPGELALTPKGQKRIIENILPSLKP